MGLERRHKNPFGRIEKTVSALLIATGIAFLTGGFQSASLWLIETIVMDAVPFPYVAV